MKNKRADFLVMDTIVIAALVLIVLIVLVIVFRGFFFDTAEGLKNIREESIDQAKGERCKTFFGFDRICAETKPSDTATSSYEIVPGDFSDCKKEEKFLTCYEKIEK